MFIRKILDKVLTKDILNPLTAIRSWMSKRHEIDTRESLISKSGLSGFDDEIEYFRNIQTKEKK